MITTRRALSADRAAVEALLVAAQLPLDGIEDCFDRFFVAQDESGIVGAAGLEVWGEHGLLRSVVVAPRASRRGLGRALTELVRQDAQRRGLRSLYLLTMSAAGYFDDLGFERVRREDLPAALSKSTQLQGACPASAIAMRVALETAEGSRA
jgi:amino-acid N-acetyltransferase